MRNLRRSPFERGPMPFEETDEAKPDITNVDGWIRSACTRDEKRIGRMFRALPNLRTVGLLEGSISARQSIVENQEAGFFISLPISSRL